MEKIMIDYDNHEAKYGLLQILNQAVITQQSQYPLQQNEYIKRRRGDSAVTNLLN